MKQLKKAAKTAKSNIQKTNGWNLVWILTIQAVILSWLKMYWMLNVKPGTIIHDTIWNDQVQRMVNSHQEFSKQ